MKKNHVASGNFFELFSNDKSTSNLYELKRDSIIANIENLLSNAVNSASLDLRGFSHAKESVVNLGYPCLTANMDHSNDYKSIAITICDILSTFEPRLLPDSILVRSIVDNDYSSPFTVLFEVSASIDDKHEKIPLSFRIALDQMMHAFKVV